MKKAFIALLALVPAATLCHSAETKVWTTLQTCQYVPDKSNDGDSFLVQCGRERFFVRLYFVDAPESDVSFPDRVRQQYEYFGVTLDELTRAGAKARDYVRGALLQRPFVLHTKKTFAQGRSKATRYYGLVQVDGRYLHQVLLSEGLARNKGSRVGLPSGEKARAHAQGLQAIEDQARLQRKGVWANHLQRPR
jgi:endonuclease YncB( thermonuclease family)